MGRQITRLYEVINTNPPSCLPVDLDKSNLVDVTLPGDTWKVYADQDTGELHRGIDYYEQAKLEEIR